jgi:hypothetical protein
MTLEELLADNTLQIISSKMGQFKAVETILDKVTTVMFNENDGKPLDLCTPDDVEKYTWNGWEFGIFDGEMFLFYKLIVK